MRQHLGYGLQIADTAGVVAKQEDYGANPQEAGDGGGCMEAECLPG